MSPAAVAAAPGMINAAHVSSLRAQNDRKRMVLYVTAAVIVSVLSVLLGPQMNKNDDLHRIFNHVERPLMSTVGIVCTVAAWSLAIWAIVQHKNNAQQ